MKDMKEISIDEYHPKSTAVDKINGDLIFYKSATVILSNDKIIILNLN